MGLDVSHGCWSAPYGAFNRWRNKVAEFLGYAVWKVKYDDGYTSDTIMLDWGHITERNLVGIWEEMPKDPAIIIFAHADHEGQIKSEHCEAIADRLEEVLPKMAEYDEDQPIKYWHKRTKEFIDGLRKAASLQEDIEFH